MSPDERKEATLRRELEEARQSYERARTVLSRAEVDLVDLGGQHPDGTQTLHNANRDVAHAANEFQRALKAFADLVLRRSGAGPKD